jgi:DHA3 family macrolide efflux protein-like MFS transporter
VSAPTDQVTLITTEPPPVRRDPIAWAWVSGATVSWFGDTVFTIALAWTAVHELPPALAGLVVGIGTLPQALLMLPGGVIADRADTRRVMITGEVGRVLILLLGVLGWTYGLPFAGSSDLARPHSAAVLFAVALSFGIVAGLSNPARSTLTRQLVRTEDLVTVGGWIQIGNRLARLGGAPIGALVVGIGGLGPAMLINAATFAAIGLLLLIMIKPRFRLPRHRGQSPIADLKEGLVYLVRTPTARTLTLGLCALNVFSTPVIAIGVAMRVSNSGWGSTWVGIAEASLAVGAILGSVVAIRWRGDHLARRAFWTLVVQGLALAAIGLPTRPTLIAGMIMVGFTAGLASVWLGGVFQAAISPVFLGRVSSVNQLGDLALTPVVLPLFGLAAGQLTLLTATIICGAGMALLCTYFATRREVRTLI